MIRRATTLWFIAAMLGLGCGDGEPSGDDGPIECVGGEFCAGNLVCVDGFCVEPGGSTNSSMDETTMGNSTTDDPTTDEATTEDPTDDPTGDGDGDGDGDGEPGDGDGESGDGDGDGDPDACTYDPSMCDLGVPVMLDDVPGQFCACGCNTSSDCPPGPMGTVPECVSFPEVGTEICILTCDRDPGACPGNSSCEDIPWIPIWDLCTWP